MTLQEAKKYRILPKYNYNGLTIVLANRSRFDTQELLTATGGYFFKNECLFPHANINASDIRLCDDTSPLYSGTKCLLLLGQRSLSLWTGASTTLAEQRGSPLEALEKWNKIPCIASFLPQDTVDIVDHEKRLNKEAEGYEEEKGLSDEDEAGQVIGNKGRGKTKRSNWRFWLRADTKKAIRILSNEKLLLPKYKCDINVYPGSSEVITELTQTKGRDFYIDIETDFDTLDMRCFAYSFGPNESGVVKVNVVPCLDIKYKPAYAELPHILRALAICMRDNCTVAHNGSMFDFLVFAHKYKLPIGRKVYDTLIAQHRIFPETEKSLGHCVAYWTYEPYHKNEGVHSYMSDRQAMQLYEYCGKDVYTMVLVKEAQLEYAQKDPGLLLSIEQAMASIKPYLAATMMGIRYEQEKLDKWIQENDKLMEQYLRMMRILCGPNVAPLISNKTCCEYFHKALNYPVVGTSQKTGKPSLAEENLVKLRLKVNNPVIDLLLNYRQRQKETGTLKFTPWKT